MKFLLTTLNAKFIHTNLAIRILYGLNQHVEGLSWKEFTIREKPEIIAEYCAQYELVAFSCYIWNISQTLQVCKKIKEINPKTHILLGGPEVSYEWENVIAHDFVDYIITGEGEIPFGLFLSKFPDIQDIPNVVSKLNDKIVYLEKKENFDVEGMKDMMPYAFENPEDLKNKVLYIETSRGCPYKCEFCLASLDNRVRYLPMQNIENTLLFLMKNGKTIKFLDRTFNIKRDFTIRIFEFILEHHEPENVFQFEITADILHPDIIRFIQEKVPKGLFRFEIGIQTVNQQANLEVSRKQNFEKTKNIILQLQDYLEIHADLIVGLALDYWNDIKFSFEQVFALYPQELQLGFLKFLKGTPVRDNFEKHGFIFDPEPPYQIIRSNYLSESELEKIVIVENALELYWNKKRCPLTLKYLSKKMSIFDFFLALGTLFLEHSQFHDYKLKDVFLSIEKLIINLFPEDQILKELLAIDYYSYYKIRPQVLILDEIDIFEKKKMLGKENKSGNYIILPIHFDYEHFMTTEEIIEKKELISFFYQLESSCLVKVLEKQLN